MQEDHRYSRVGRVLEKTKLNELPQLMNVVLGDMSLVGPRPEIPDFTHCFTGPYDRLLDYRPGLFGPSQSTYRNEASMYPVGRDAKSFYEQVLFKRKAEMDLAYYPSATNIDDFCWMVRSIAAVFAEYRTAPDGLSTLPH